MDTLKAAPEALLNASQVAALLNISQLEALLNASQVAKTLNISKTKAYEMMASGEIPCIKIRGSRRVQPSVLRELMARWASASA